MRELKFRAWDTQFKLMSSPMNLRNGLDFFHFGVSRKGQLLRALASDTIEVMQFTGLKDKNGVEIYDGDIVKFFFNRKEYNMVIKWGLDGWWISTSGWFKDLYWGHERAEIIGNIYENKELLEDAN